MTPQEKQATKNIKRANAYMLTPILNVTFHT